MNNFLLIPDVFKSIVLHGMLLIVLIVGNYINNKKVFVEIKLPPANPVQASLIDQQAVEQAVKKQEKLFSEKIAREKLLVQQEQKSAEEAKKNKKERELLKKEQDDLQKSISQLKKQQQDLLAEKAKIEQLKQKYLTAQQTVENQKKKVNNNISGEISGQEQSIIETYRGKMISKIIDNRKDPSLFPPHLQCVIAVKVLADGGLASVKLITSSGNSVYDAFSEQAVYKAAPFEVPLDPKLIKEFTDYEHNLAFTIKT